MGCSKPAIIRSTVVLPEPGRTEHREELAVGDRPDRRPSTARTDPKVLARSVNRIDGETARSRMNQKVLAAVATPQGSVALVTCSRRRRCPAQACRGGADARLTHAEAAQMSAFLMICAVSTVRCDQAGTGSAYAGTSDRCGTPREGDRRGGEEQGDHGHRQHHVGEHQRGGRVAGAREPTGQQAGLPRRRGQGDGQKGGREGGIVTSTAYAGPARFIREAVGLVSNIFTATGPEIQSAPPSMVNTAQAVAETIVSRRVTGPAPLSSTRVATIAANTSSRVPPSRWPIR